MCIVCITRGSTHFAAVPSPVHLGQGRAEKRQGSRVRQGREKNMKQRGRKNKGENNKEETEDEHGNKCKVKKTQQHRTKMQAGTYPVLSSIRHVSCILHEGARDCSAFSILDRDEVELILCIVCIVHENH